MIKVEDLTVKVTYKVGLGDLEIPKNVYEQLQSAFNEGKELDPSDTRFYPEAALWLSDNIKERDCMEWSAEVEELSNTK